MEEEGEGNESIDDVNQDYNQNFMMNMNRWGKHPKYTMTFDYGFLAPRRADVTHEDDMNYRNSKDLEMRIGEQQETKDEEKYLVYDLNE